ncbi:hypothetical protein PBAL39_12960 [Pedobacter sp. BAL39]|nr:hypothetical protein PBAL39_12960 [Pedobacter sp. BAL39]
MTLKVFVDLVNGWGRAEVMNYVVAGFTVLIHCSLFRLLIFSKRQVIGFGWTAVFMGVTTAGMLIMAAHLMEFWEPFTDQITRTFDDSRIYLNLILALIAIACYKIAKQTKLN